MATLTAGSAGPVDMTNLQMNFLQGASDSIYNANLVRVDTGGGSWDDFQGSGFTYSSGGGGYYGYTMDYDPIGGVISNVTEVTNSAAILSVGGLSMDAAGFFGMLRNADTGGM